MNEVSAELNRDERLSAILADWLEEADSGHAPDEEVYLDRYPEFADSLRQHFADWKRFTRPTVSPAGPARPSTPPAQVGEHEILCELGRGGMAIVYKARHARLNRLVALKMLLTSGPGFELDVKRLRNEAEVVAALDHPNIVPLHEVGEHDGQVYLTMKLVEGGRLTDQLPRFAADPRSAARLMAQVARAVHHAHQRGILHRDLKPSNILLDAEGKPYVTDFGLARRLGTDSELTQSGALVGTPAYMAPEQASGSSRSITTGTDVHGLGSVLYALLTGVPPFKADTPQETLDRVRKEEPVAPRRLNRAVPVELETITLKALQKNPEDRYSSAKELADDLERFLRDEPTLARRPTVWQRTRKWCRRHVVAVRATAVLLTAILAVVGAAGWWLRDQAIQSEIQMASHLARALLAEKGLQDALAAAIKANAETDVVARKNLDLMEDLADSQRQGKGFKRALAAQSEFVRKELNPENAAFLPALRALAIAYNYAQQKDEAIATWEELLKLQTDKLGPGHPDTLATVGNLGGYYLTSGNKAKASALYLKALPFALANFDPNTAAESIVYRVSEHYWENGQLEKFVSITQDALKACQAKFGHDDKRTLNKMRHLATAYCLLERPEDSVALYKKVIAHQVAKFGPGAAEIRTDMFRLANVYSAAGRFKDAVPLFEEALDRTKKSNPANERVYTVRIAALYRAAGQFEKSQSYYKAGIDLVEKELGPQRVGTHFAKQGLALTLVLKNKPDVAEPMLRQAKDAVEKLRGQLDQPGSPNYVYGRVQASFGTAALGFCLVRLKRFEEAEPLLLAGYEGLKIETQLVVAIERKIAMADAADWIIELYEAWEKKSQADEWRQKKLLIPKGPS